jgi:hypothetical protein
VDDGDDGDAWASNTAVFRTCLGLGAFWGLFIAPPFVFGGISRGDGIFLASTALAFCAILHLVRIGARSGRTAMSGPLAGMPPAAVWEVTEAVRQGRAVSDPGLAQAAVDHARQRLRMEGILRVLLPIGIVLQVVDLVSHRHAPAATLAAYGAVRTVPLIVLSILALGGYRRAAGGEEANWRLIEGGGAR